MVGKEYPSERKIYLDSKTGVKITRVTSFPTVNYKIYFHINQFTPDSKTLIFYSYRTNSRSSVSDIYRVNVDGLGLVQMTDCPNLSGGILSHDGKYIYYMNGGTLIRVDMNTAVELEINNLDRVKGFAGCSSLTEDDSYIYMEAELDNVKRGILKFSTDGKDAEIIFEKTGITHTQVEPSEGKIVAFQHGPDKEHRNIWLIDKDGSHLRPLELPYGNGHWMWVGNTKRIMTNLESSCWGISIYGEGEEKPETIVSGGRNFWHASCSRDGEWIVSDTNWPDCGLQLINIRTKKYTTLCYPESSSGHPQWSHPHPSFSPDGKLVVFNSDATGIPHVYIAEIPEEMLEKLSR